MRPRLGFLGVGWIGRHRMQAVIEAGRAEIVAIADPSADMRSAAHALAPNASIGESLEEVLATGVDGVVIATPSALHAAQSIQVLSSGAAVFCQKPLGRTEQEVVAVVQAARASDRLLDVDLSYRFTDGMRAIRKRIVNGELGRVYAVDLTFHNAYGPDKDWFYDRAASGGGCVMDLGVHLVDLCLWTLGFPAVEAVSARLFAAGSPWRRDHAAIEDYAVARLDLSGGIVVQLACSWKLNLGCDAVIVAAFHGTQGGAVFSNVDGSFYDFTAQVYQGGNIVPLAVPPDAWGGRAITAWVERLEKSRCFDVDCEKLIDVARTLDRIYKHCSPESVQD